MNQVSKESASDPATLRGLVLAAAALAAISAAAGFLLAGPVAALGGGFGAAVGGGYAWSYRHSHLKNSDAASLNAAMAGGATARLLVAGGVGFAMWLSGRFAIISYLLAFAVSFAALAVPQVVRAARRIHPGATRGVRPDGVIPEPGPIVGEGGDKAL